MNNLQKILLAKQKKRLNNLEKLKKALIIKESKDPLTGHWTVNVTPNRKSNELQAKVMEQLIQQREDDILTSKSMDEFIKEFRRLWRLIPGLMEPHKK
jgi:hypothetical protein